MGAVFLTRIESWGQRMPMLVRRVTAARIAPTPKAHANEPRAELSPTIAERIVVPIAAPTCPDMLATPVATPMSM